MKTPDTASTLRDPVCGMVVDPTSAAGHSEFRGQTYYFCSAHCQQKFDADLANALPAKVAADKKARVEGSVKNIAKLAGDLDKAGDDNNQAGTEANLKKLDGVLMALEKQVK